MAFESFVCVFLMSCLLSNTPLTPEEFPSCPDHCQCYPAQEGGDGQPAITLVCDWRHELIAEQYALLSKELINSIVIENLYAMNSLTENVLTGLKINNIVVRRLSMLARGQGREILSKSDKKSLKVLTFIDCSFIGIENILFNWKTFDHVDNVQAIHFSGGQLVNISDIFLIIPVQNVFSLTIDKTILKHIEPAAFRLFAQLRTLRVTQTSIASLDWMLSIKSPSKIRYLDLRNNEIKSFPVELAQKLTDLRRLMLGGNNLHIISSETVNILFGHLKEFSLEPIKGLVKKEYFYSTNDMSWIKDVLDGNTARFKNIPWLLTDKLADYPCITEVDLKFPTPCSKIGHFNYPARATSDQLTCANINNDYHFAYQNKQILLIGGVLPNQWKEDNLVNWIGKLANIGANVIKFRLNMIQWFKLPIPNEHAVDFENMAIGLEKYLKLAQDNNIFVIISLWDISTLPPEFLDPKILAIYLDGHVKPLVKRLNRYRSLAAWEIFDKPEDLVLVNEINPTDPCLHTSNIQRPHPGVGKFKIKQVQQFMAEHARIMHQTVPRKLVTITMHEYMAFKENVKGFNHFEDQCLSKAIGPNECVDDDCALDFYIVSIRSNGLKLQNSFQPKELSEQSPKPIVIIADGDYAHIENVLKNKETWQWKDQGLIATLSPDIYGQGHNNAYITDCMGNYSFKMRSYAFGPQLELNIVI